MIFGLYPFNPERVVAVVNDTDSSQGYAFTADKIDEKSAATGFVETVDGGERVDQAVPGGAEDTFIVTGPIRNKTLGEGVSIKTREVVGSPMLDGLILLGVPALIVVLIAQLWG
jgi:hypothetical protein